MRIAFIYLWIRARQKGSIIMSLLDSILLGILQGISEFIPASSYGQLLLAEHLLQIENVETQFFAILLHIGSAIAICVIFRKDIKRNFRAFIQMMPAIGYNISTYFYNLLHEQEERKYQIVMRNNYQKFAGMLCISTLCCFVTAASLNKVSLHFGDSLLSIGLNFLIMSVILLVVDLWKHGTTIPNDMNVAQAALIGICHGLGVIPGISSLGITIAVCLLCGLRKNFAVRYSFLLFIPAAIGAFLFRFWNIGSWGINSSFLANSVAGFVVTVIVSLLSARLMLRMLTKSRLRIFAIYSFLIGIFAIINNFM